MDLFRKPSRYYIYSKNHRCSWSTMVNMSTSENGQGGSQIAISIGLRARCDKLIVSGRSF